MNHVRILIDLDPRNEKLARKRLRSVGLSVKVGK
ncbi:hypothetical protein LCGC14_1430420 [marine sediment metagenome]|uniref:Uncharacterized protein n=1 Tax=marine sediment metagenome TaxID=412755 RepID=A0A0F9JNS6_9ZZZZ